MLNFVQTEWMKLRRKKMIWFMLLAAFVMPFFACVYFNYFKTKGVDPMAFYKLAVFRIYLFYHSSICAWDILHFTDAR